ncbi:MAG: ATP-binding protein [Candidatus Viridilinea halotolerans]|uniref:ATP-binding protein n=1 Tax=Candidatus Viridilinea halotolerans TaxID=2491704 RepID=A0A426TP88_9CHLR|nr:MAG: ATP-binding protein [Candidatus Viridilinea halotolerans]
MSNPLNNSMDLSFPSELGYEVIARDAVSAFARRLGLSAERVEDLKTALSEACINAIEHGNSLRPDLRVFIHCHLEPDRLVIEVIDQGATEFVARDNVLSISEKIAGLGSLRGMGLMLISQLCDESSFVPGPEGNCMRLAFSR